MMRVISSPSNSTTGLATLIFDIVLNFWTAKVSQICVFGKSKLNIIKEKGLPNGKPLKYRKHLCLLTSSDSEGTDDIIHSKCWSISS